MKNALSLLICLSFLLPAYSQAEETAKESVQETNLFDSGYYDPRDPKVLNFLRNYDEMIYEGEAWQEGYNELNENFLPIGGCYQLGCPVFIHIDKSKQVAHIFLHGQAYDTWKVSTGLSRYETPNFDRNPNGRIYNRYSSRKYPGGDYQGLGNMPYAIFIQGGYAMHGTPKSNWSKLGQKASHGCIRMHPTNAEILNGMVRNAGIDNTWITVSNSGPNTDQTLPPPRKDKEVEPAPKKEPQTKKPEKKKPQVNKRAKYNACIKKARKKYPFSKKRRHRACKHYL